MQVAFQTTSSSSVHYGEQNYNHALGATVLTVKGLYFINPDVPSVFVGGGVGWGRAVFGSGGDAHEDWHASGLEGVLTAGYAIARADTSTRWFVQVDAVRPFYEATLETPSMPGVAIARRRTRSIVVSVGIGW